VIDKYGYRNQTVWRNPDSNSTARRYHTSKDCVKFQNDMVEGDRQELDRSGWMRCSNCRKLDGDGPYHIQEFLESANPEDIGLSKMGERNV